MRLSIPAKSFLAGSLLLVTFAGCGLWQNGPPETAPVIPDIKSEIPFSTREPENFECEIVINSGGLERKIFVARKGEMRRIDYNFGEPDQHGFLQADKEYLLSFAGKAYAEKDPVKVSENNVQFSDLTSELLNRKDYSEFEEIGREDSLTKYRARINESASAEIYIYIDETIAMPVKQEFFSIEGDIRTLQYSMELRNFKAVADDRHFAVPAGFRKITLEEFYRILR